MDTMRVLIADSSDVFCAALAEALQGSYQVRTCQDGQEALEWLGRFSPDILVLDMMLPGLDGISLLQAAAASGLRPMVLATTRFVSAYVMDTLEQLGVGYLMIKPCDISAMAARIGDLSQRLNIPVNTQPDTKTSLSKLLVSLGMHTKLRGYSCVREGILLTIQNPDQRITKELYPAVAAICGGNALRVERAIRSAIESAWMNRDDRVWRMYFPPDANGQIPRPTNSEFISRLADQFALAGEQ